MKSNRRKEIEDLVCRIYKNKGCSKPEPVWFGAPIEVAAFLACIDHSYRMGSLVHIAEKYRNRYDAWKEERDKHGRFGFYFMDESITVIHHGQQQANEMWKTVFGSGIYLPHPVMFCDTAETLLRFKDRRISHTSAIKDEVNGLWHKGMDRMIGAQLRWDSDHRNDKFLDSIARSAYSPSKIDAARIEFELHEHNLWCKLAKIYHGWFWMVKDMLLLSEEPCETHTAIINGNPVFHNDKGPAIVFPDGWCLYSVQGTHIPYGVGKFLTPDRIYCSNDSYAILSVVNAQIRQLLIDIQGVDNILARIRHRVIDQEEDYSLILVWVENLEKMCPFLKMKNPTTKKWHFEGVPMGCKTVDDALFARNGTRERPVILT